MWLISLLMRAKFEGNPITCLHFMQVCEKKKKKKKKRDFLKAYTVFQEQLA